MLITLKRDIRPPTAPVLGTPVVLGTTSIQITLATAASDPNGIASYTLEYSTALGGTYTEVTSAAVFPQTVSGLTASTAYFFRAKAVDNYGNHGPYSGIVTATTQSVTPSPTLSWPAHVPAYTSLIPEVGGYGMNTVAGSGRHLGTPATTVILVNSLAAGNTGSAVTGYGPNVFAGTWEYAWRHSASPKVIIPIISGWVTIQDSVNCQGGARTGYVSYYGQFAPGQGLYLRGCNVETGGASNVAVWHLRSYMGDDVTGLPAGNRDCFSSGYGQGVTQQIVLINCEFAWSVDEIAGFFRSHNQVTCAGCAFFEPLHVSTVIHPEDGAGFDHGFGPMFGGDTGQPQTSAVSTFRNLWAHTTGRNPLVSSQTFVHANNLHYNHGRPSVGQGSGVQIVPTGATVANFANIIGNGFVRGPNNNNSLVAVAVTGSFPTGSAGYLFANSQFGWTAPSSQNGFLTTSPSGYAASSVQSTAYPSSWGTGLTGVLQWAANPLAPTLTEWNNFVTLMDRTVGAQPIRRTTGRLKRVFDQIRDRLAGVTQTDQFVDTVTEAGGWFTVPSVTVDPLNPGSEWHAPLPTGSDRDTPYTSGTFSDGKSRIGYTRLEEWAYEQHLYVTTDQPLVDPEEPGAADVWDADWDFVVNRTDPESTVDAVFRAAGFDGVMNIENGTADTTGGWLYTVTSIPGYTGEFPQGASRVLCVETNPRDLGGIWQSDPSIQFWAEPSSNGNIPPDCWIQWWQYNCRSGTQQSTFDGRDKTLYVSNSNPIYPSTDYPWLALQGSAGFQHSPAPNNVDNFLALQAARAAVPYDSGSDPAGYMKMFQNLSNAVITPNAWFQVKMHINTSGAQGSWEAWIRQRGAATWTKVAEWLPGVTQFNPGNGVGTFQWSTSVNDRTGAKQMRWPSTTNGQGNHAFRYFGRLELASSEDLLSTGD